ncbi:RNA-binding protein [bacterium]|nr:RNA-binding protein [bacterium]
MQTKLFVQNLTTKCSEEDLQNLFSSYGEVISTRIPTDRESGRGRGFGFVEMLCQNAADNALHDLDKKSFNGRILHVAFSRSERSGGSGSGSGSRNRTGTRSRSIAYSYLC